MSYSSSAAAANNGAAAQGVGVPPEDGMRPEAPRGVSYIGLRQAYDVATDLKRTTPSAVVVVLAKVHGASRTGFNEFLLDLGPPTESDEAEFIVPCYTTTRCFSQGGVRREVQAMDLVEVAMALHHQESCYITVKGEILSSAEQRRERAQAISTFVEILDNNMMTAGRTHLLRDSVLFSA